MMRDKINGIVSNAFKYENPNFKWDYEIYFGYDCIEITIIESADVCISLDLFSYLKESLKTEIGWVSVKDDCIVVGYDISKFILDEYETWSNYELSYKFYLNSTTEGV